MIKTSPATPEQFPLAYEAINWLGLIVLFTGKTKGVVVREANERGHALGQYAETWQSCNNTEHWRPINITIAH